MSKGEWLLLAALASVSLWLAITAVAIAIANA